MTPTRKPVRHRAGPRHQFNFDWIPTELYTAVREKAARDGVSLRGLVLRYLDGWARQSTASPRHPQA